MNKKPNREYKDTVFVDLFGKDINAKQNFLRLYNALHGTDLSDTAELKNIELEQVIYTGLRNDISFMVDNKLIVLAEHQSTVNENMPLRFLEYIARLYEKTQDVKNRYSRKLIKIPTPEFFVFYNGVENYPTEKTLKLSDAFLEYEEEAALDLIVKVFNINKNKNSPLLKKCKTLNEYSIFVEETRKLYKEDPEKGFETAIKNCISNGILKEYLERKTKEVHNMLIAEYDYATDIAVQREEAFSLGRKNEIIKTITNMKKENFDNSIISKITGLSEKEIELLHI